MPPRVERSAADATEPNPTSDGGGTAATRRACWQLASLAIGAIAALIGLDLAFRDRDVAFEEVALGAATHVYLAQVDGDPIHCFDLGDGERCLRGYARRGARAAAIWLGNSQLHAVNQYEEGQETATPILHRVLAADGLDLVAFSQPNANLQEHLVLYSWLAERLKIRALVLPMVFDDCRETGLRESIARALLDPAVVARLERTQIGRTIVASGRKQSSNEDLAALAGTAQERVEAALVGWLDAHVPLWAQRPQIRGSLMLDLYRVRNAVFGITSVSTRRMIPGRLAMNLEAARALLEDARERGIATVVYVAPLRRDVAPPYVASEYEAFRRDVAALAGETGAHFADLDGLGPAEAWGRTDASGLGGEAEVDFMHFRAEGHVLLAHAVERLVRDAVDDAS
jgi:hypothetical protein